MKHSKSTVHRYVKLLGLKRMFRKLSNNLKKKERPKLLNNSNECKEMVQEYITHSLLNGVLISSANQLKNMLVNNGMIDKSFPISSFRRYCKS